ncbi:MFS transporter [Alicyclobacillus sp. ALC3]|uniref:MFS transporter n=1 Tax=Alicyclobacillus sp. ALC3 TaxID=2796143 RepID=UPI0023794B1A|nr:MFS transporter [Alicyclobacillus sp. ALC3]WDL99053.1 MFS transporter [Alicyclobacillus sp. ALC3]
MSNRDHDDGIPTSMPTSSAATTADAPAATGGRSSRPPYVHRLGMAGLSRNVGFGSNKVFAAALLQTFNASQPVIGFVLALEGLFGLILSPLTGWLSDRTHHPFWRRKVYVLVALPLAGITWLLFCSSHNFALAAVALSLFYIFEQSSVSPYQAWIPDITPPALWGVASGWLNLWWEVGNLVAFLAIPLVWEASHLGGYVLTAVLVAGGGLVTGLSVPEAASGRAGNVAGATPAGAASPQAAGAASGVASGKASGISRQNTRPRPNYKKLLERNFVFYFLSQALAWVAFESIGSFFTLFIKHSAHGTTLDAGLAMSVFTVTGMGGAVWSGRKYGQGRWTPKRLLASSLALFGALAVLGMFYHSLVLVFVIVGIEGVFWGVNLTVAYALATSLLRDTARDEAEETAIRGGLYGMSNFVQSVGLIVAAPVAGIVIRLGNGNYGGMFLVSCIAGLAGAVMVLFIRPKHAATA